MLKIPFIGHPSSPHTIDIKDLLILDKNTGEIKTLEQLENNQSGEKAKFIKRELWDFYKKSDKLLYIIKDFEEKNPENC